MPKSLPLLLLDPSFYVYVYYVYVCVRVWLFMYVFEGVCNVVRLDIKYGCPECVCTGWLR